MPTSYKQRADSSKGRHGGKKERPGQVKTLAHKYISHGNKGQHSQPAQDMKGSLNSKQEQKHSPSKPMKIGIAFKASKIATRNKFSTCSGTLMCFKQPDT